MYIHAITISRNIGLLDQAQDDISYDVSLANASGISIHETEIGIGDVRQIVFEGAASDTVYEEVCCLN